MRLIRWSRPRALLPGLALLLLAGCGDRCATSIPTPGSPGGVMPSLLAGYQPLPSGSEVAGLVFTFPITSGGEAFLSIYPLPSATVTPEELRPVTPAAALTRQGLYLAVLNSSAGTTKYLAQVADPRVLLSEGADFSSGLITGVTHDMPGGSFAARFPYLPGARLVIFEVNPAGSISEVHLDLTLPAILPTTRARFRQRRSP